MKNLISRAKAKIASIERTVEYWRISSGLKAEKKRITKAQAKIVELVDRFDKLKV